MSKKSVSFPTEEPIKLKLSEIAYQTLESDLSLFQLDSLNQLMNRVFVYFGKNQMKKDYDFLKKFEKLMNSLSLETPKKHSLKLLVLEHMISYKNSKSLKRMSFRPHASEVTVYENMNLMTSKITNNKASLPLYLSYILDSFAKKNRAERTKIVFHDTYDIFMEALKGKKQIAIQTKFIARDIINPIDILSIFDNEVIIFACEDENNELKLFELSSIQTIELLDTTSTYNENHSDSIETFKTHTINLSSFRSYFDKPDKTLTLLNMIIMIKKGDS
jgi:sulfur relay (sulfurtransferase) DsrF/TusC family protein